MEEGGWIDRLAAWIDFVGHAKEREENLAASDDIVDRDAVDETLMDDLKFGAGAIGREML